MALIDVHPIVASSTTELWDDGSFAAPSAHFAAEPGVGLYRPSAGVIGVAGVAEIQATRTRARSVASAASNLSDLIHTPGAIILTGSTTTTSFAFHRLANTAIDNTPGPATITDLHQLIVEAPTALGPATNKASITAGLSAGSGIYGFYAAGTASSGWSYPFTWGNPATAITAKHGAFAYLTSSGVRFSAILQPGANLDGSAHPGLLQFTPSDGTIATTSMGWAANAELYWTTYAPVSSATTGGTITRVSALDWSTSQTNDGLVWALATANATLVICEYGDRNTDLGMASKTDPTIFVLDAAATANTFLQIDHDGLDTGSANDLLLRSNGQTGFTVAEAAGAPEVSLYGVAPVARQTVSGSRLGNPALTNLLTALATLGAIVDGTTA